MLREHGHDSAHGTVQVHPSRQYATLSTLMLVLHNNVQNILVSENLKKSIRHMTVETY